MKEISYRLFALFAAGLIVAPSYAQAPAQSQAPTLRPVTVGKPMPDFTLPTYQDGSVTLSQLRGKTVVLVFPRGRVTPDAWCGIDNFQHGSLVDLDFRTQFQKANNAEILIVFPYDKAEVAKWVERYPAQIAKLAENENSRYKVADTFTVTDKSATTFPILLDSDHSLTEGLGIFTTDWGRSKEEQNVPTVIVVDPDGIVQFKYFGQNTVDRPDIEYVSKVVKWINE